MGNNAANNTNAASNATATNNASTNSTTKDASNQVASGIVVQTDAVFLPPADQQTQQNNFLKIEKVQNAQGEMVFPDINVTIYNSGHSGWSFGKLMDGGNAAGGWFPTSCIKFDLVKSNYAFQTKPEETRPYISFEQGTHIVVENRLSCGWWIGSVLESQETGHKLSFKWKLNHCC